MDDRLSVQRLAALFLALLLGCQREESPPLPQAAPPQVAPASLGTGVTLASGNSGGAVVDGVNWTFATSAVLAVGDIGVCAVAIDEGPTVTVDGVGNTISSFGDATGTNVWTELVSWCRNGNATVANGACSFLYYTKATAQLNSGANLIVDPLFTGVNSPRLAAVCMKFTGGTVTAASGANGASFITSEPGAMTVDTGVAAPHLFLRGVACEATAASVFTATTSGYTGFGQANSDTGTPGTSMMAAAEYKIETVAISTTSDPSVTNITNPQDCASAMGALDEAATRRIFRMD